MQEHSSHPCSTRIHMQRSQTTDPKPIDPAILIASESPGHRYRVDPLGVESPSMADTFLDAGRRKGQHMDRYTGYQIHTAAPLGAQISCRGFGEVDERQIEPRDPVKRLEVKLKLKRPGATANKLDATSWIMIPTWIPFSRVQRLFCDIDQRDHHYTAKLERFRPRPTSNPLYSCQ